MKPARSSARGLFQLFLLSLAAVSLLQGQAGPAQPVATINTGEDLPVVAAWAPDGQRLAYGTETRVQSRRARDDESGTLYPGEVWVSDLAGKPKRILKHDFLRSREGDFFSFSVERLAWSPDGSKLAVEISDERKNTAAFLFSSDGKRIDLGSSSQNFVPGYGAAWLGDSESLALLSEAVPPRLLHRVGVVRVAAGRVVPLFEGSTFAAVAWLPRAHKAVLVERDVEFARAPRLMLGDLKTGQLETLDELREGYLGGLEASPDESQVSYFVGQEKLAVRRLAPDAPVEHLPIPFGRYAWAGTEGALLFIEPKERGGRTGWLTLYDSSQDRKQRVLPEELIQDFWVAADGQRVAVLTVGLKPTLQVYSLAPAP